MPVSSSTSRSTAAIGCSSPSQKPAGADHMSRQGSCARRTRRTVPSRTTMPPAPGFAFRQWLRPHTPHVTGGGAGSEAPQPEQKRVIDGTVNAWSARRPRARGRRPLGFANPLDRRGLLRRRLALAEPLDHVGDVGELLLQVALVVLEPVEPLLAVAEPPEAAPAPVPVSMSVAHGHLPSRTGRGTTR